MLGEIYSVRGDKAKGRKWLKKAVECGDVEKEKPKTLNFSDRSDIVWGRMPSGVAEQG